MVRKLKSSNPTKAPNSQNSIIQKAKVMQEAMLAVQEGLKDKFVEASVAGEQIKVKANGQKKIVELKIGKEIIEEAVLDPKELESLILTAVNDVLKKAEELTEQEMEKVTGGVSIPGLF